ncbi:hypothetical protein [Oceanobacillus rekensis]|uniref:hypothetical protein n=1 Tax=Oceanobacillus rekensis TaxID=937927 RepID=UPI0015939FA8|nr:hypothetical protein [Oceanobacillus rekensis]
MSEKEKLQNMLQRVIDETENNTMQSAKEVIQSLISEITINARPQESKLKH